MRFPILVALLFALLLVTGTSARACPPGNAGFNFSAYSQGGYAGAGACQPPVNLNLPPAGYGQTNFSAFAFNQGAYGAGAVGYGSGLTLAQRVILARQALAFRQHGFGVPHGIGFPGKSFKFRR